MKKLYQILALCMMFIATAANAQESSSVTFWDGSSTTVSLKAGETKTFQYTAEGTGSFYIIAKTQTTTLPVDITGGVWLDGSYDESLAFEVTDKYDNGTGIYANITVWEGDLIRFNLSAAADATESETEFTMTSLFFNRWYGGNSFDNPIELERDVTKTLPVCKNQSSIFNTDYPYTTYCSFTAPSNGVASIYTEEYLVYYLEEEYFDGMHEMKYSVQDAKTNDHEFIVEEGKKYIIMLPLTRPSEATFKMTSTRVGEVCNNPIVIKSSQSLDLAKGDNWFKIDAQELGVANFMEMQVAAGWNGSINFYNDCDMASDVISAKTISNAAVTYNENIDPNFTGTRELYLNIKVTNVESIKNAITLELREAKEGEACSSAIPVTEKTTSFEAAARNYWFQYTAKSTANLTIKAEGCDVMYAVSNCAMNALTQRADGSYRVNEGDNVLVCLSVAEAGTKKISFEENELVMGDDCDNPIDFALGTTMTIQNPGEAIKFYRFTATESGYAVIKTTCEEWVTNYWSVNIKDDCNGYALDYIRSEYEDENTGALGLSYKWAITAGKSYIIEISQFETAQKEFTIESQYEAAVGGTSCETALAIESLNEKISLPFIPENILWYTYTADKSGFYTVHVKLGRGCTMQVKVGDCAAQTVNSTNDNSFSDAYMKGYKMCKVYVEEGTPFFVYTKTNSELSELEENEESYYLSVTFAEARPGEYFGLPIQAEKGVAYTLPTGDENYDKWYVYTIPANTEEVFTVTSDIVPVMGSLGLYQNEKTTYVATTAYRDGVYTMVSNKNADNKIINKTYTFEPSAEGYVVYIKTSYQKNLTSWYIGQTPVGIDEVKEGISINIYPNPSSGIFYVNVPEVGQNTQVTVTSITGATIYKQVLTSTSTQINLSNKLSTGIYLVTVTEGGQNKATSKLIIK